MLGLALFGRLENLIRQMWRARKGDFLPLLVILLCTLILFQDAIRRGWVYYEFDTSMYYYPVMRWLDSAVDQNLFPLWSPYVFGGFPLFADGEGGALYPPTVALLALLSSGQAFVAAAVLHYFLAGAFTYAFLRVLRQNRLPALIAGLTFEFGSFMITQMHHMNLVQSAVWLPLILLLVEVALRVDGWRRVAFTVLAGGSLALQVLTMHVQPVLMTMLTVGLWIAFRSLSGGWLGLARRAAIGLAVGFAVLVLALGLSAAQLLPMAELATQAVRGSDQGYNFGSSFGPAVPSLITLVFPYFFRFHGYDYWTLWFRWETTVYVGIAPLAFAAIAVVLRRSREVLFFAGLALVVGVLMLGDYSPVNLYWLWWQIPGLSGLRAPGRFSFLVVFSLAVLAGMGVHHLQDRLSGAKRPRSIAAVVGVLATAGLVLTGVIVLGGYWLGANRSQALELITNSYLNLRRQPGIQLSLTQIYDALRSTLDWHNSRTDLSVLLVFATGLVILFWYRYRQRAVLWQTLLVPLVAFDLLAFAVIYHPQTPIGNLESAGPVGNFLALHNGLHRVYTQQMMGPTVPNRLLPLGIPSVGGYSSLEGARYREYLRLVRQGNVALLDLLNVRYVVAPKFGAPPGPPAKYRTVFEGADAIVYENADYLPRAFVVTHAVIVDSPKAALDVLSQRGFDPRASVVLEAEGQSLSTGGSDAATPPATRDAARVTEYGSTIVRVEAEADKDGYLVLADAFYPGWQATIDGKKAAIYPGDYLFRAVRLPRGHHTIVFQYEPSAFRLGTIISLSTLAVASTVLAGAYALGRRPAARTEAVLVPAV